MDGGKVRYAAAAAAADDDDDDRDDDNDSDSEDGEGSITDILINLSIRQMINAWIYERMYYHVKKTLTKEI